MKQETGKDAGGVPSADVLAAQITTLAEAGDFSKAEKLRDLLLQEHPMALGAIIATAEVIEEQKGLRMDQDHLAVWDTLYSSLTQEERTGLFYMTKAARVASGKLLVRQGKPIPRLLFIDSGRVTLFHSRGEERILLGQLSSGDILGDETFFGLSNPTFSAGAQSEVRLRFLDRSSTAKWEEEHPGLFLKLTDYCLRNCRAKELLQNKNIEKRVFPRVKGDCRVAAHILHEDGNRSGNGFRGSLIDISQNGVCFDFHCSRQETAQAMLGRRLDVEFEPRDSAKGKALVRKGIIVKIGFVMHNEYSVHVQLDSELSRQVVEEIVKS